MAKFITTKQITSELEDLIKKADERLYIVSPYLKLSKDFRDLLTYRNTNRKDTKIIFGKQELNPEQMTFFQGLRFVYLFFSEDLHAKCYINDTKMIITSMNFYDFSMMNNKEMGILIDNTANEDNQVYNDAWNEIDLIEKTSKPFDFVSKPISSTSQTQPTKEIKIEPKVDISTPQKINSFDGKYFSATALSKEIGISSKDLTYKIEKLKWIEKKNEEWILTSLGKSLGAQMKKGQYGEYIAYPETILKELI
ncbi:MAG: phospholipase D family protein [Bacteroidota bacterium]|nr:phospholipase D family protein [Bacteroidota bacterium]